MDPPKGSIFALEIMSKFPGLPKRETWKEVRLHSARKVRRKISLSWWLIGTDCCLIQEVLPGPTKGLRTTQPNQIATIDISQQRMKKHHWEQSRDYQWRKSSEQGKLNGVSLWIGRIQVSGIRLRAYTSLSCQINETISTPRRWNPFLNDICPFQLFFLDELTENELDWVKKHCTEVP
jgi:hypothetical protein